MMRNCLKQIMVFASLFIVLGLQASQLMAAPNLRVVSPPSKVPLQQSVVLRVILEWPSAEGPYDINPGEPLLENLNRGSQTQSQETGPQITSHILVYEFTPMGKGPARILPFEVNFRLTAEDPWTPLLVPEQSVEVVKAFPSTFLIISGFVGILGAIIVAVSMLVRKAIAKRQLASATEIRDPKQKIYVEARDSLLAFQSMEPKERLRHYAAQLRKVVSTYYDLCPADTAEGSLRDHLQKMNLPHGEWAEVSGLLEQLEQMRFSNRPASPYDIDRMQKTLLQYMQGKIIIEKSP